MRGVRAEAKPLGQRLVAGAVRSATPVVAIWVPGVELDGSVGDLLNAIADVELKKAQASLRGDYEALSKPAQTRLLAELRERTRQSL